jgi:hypothetical protein
VTLDGVVRDVKGLFKSREELLDDYDSSLQFVGLCTRWLNDGLRAKYITPSQANTIARGLASDVDHLIGEHPFRFKAWRIVKEDAAALKNELSDSVRRTNAYTWDFYASLRDLAPDDKTFAYEQIPEQPARGEVKLAEPVYVPEQARKVHTIAHALQTPRKAKVSSDDEWYQSETYKESTKAGAKCLVIGMLAGYGTFGAAMFTHYLNNKGVNVTALYGAVLGTALLGHAMNTYQERQRSRPQQEYVVPVEPQPVLAAPAVRSVPSAFNVRVGATMISLCALMSMMGGNASAYDREAAKPHKARQIAEYAQLVFPDEFPR